MTSKVEQIKLAIATNPNATEADLAATCGCSQSYVSKVIGKLEDREIDESLGFKLSPPKESQKATSSEPDNEYQCGSCGHAFESVTKPESCPSCGVAFE